MIYQDLPSIDSPYFKLKSAGGYYQGVPGNKQVKEGSSLNNCVAAAWGLFAMQEENPNCLVGCGSRSVPMPLNAQEWFSNSKGYETGKTPREGSIIVYGGTGTAGHVAYVNGINGNELTLIESNYGSRSTKGLSYRKVVSDNNYFISNTAGNFIGFIYPKKVQENSPGNTLKSIAEIAKEVIAGKWGVYPERKTLLENAGYNYKAVQTMVNSLTYSQQRYENVAREVIRGIWGNGTERKNRLTKAGYDYNRVQSIVNTLLK